MDQTVGEHVGLSTESSSRSAAGEESYKVLPTDIGPRYRSTIHARDVDVAVATSGGGMRNRWINPL